jgi:hypothetical protein
MRREGTRNAVRLLIITAVAFLVSLVVIRQIRERLLFRKLDEYQRILTISSLQRTAPPQLSRTAIPILLDWIETDEIQSDEEHLRFNLWHYSGMRVFEPSKYLRRLALSGFDILGTKATTALPRLTALVRTGEDFSPALMSLADLGEAAYPAAIELTKSDDAMLRSEGAFLIGLLRTRKEESVSVLLKLIEDSDKRTRNEAFAALAEFPSPRTAEAALGKLLSIATNTPPGAFDSANDAGYALHSAAPQFLLRLSELCRDSTNVFVRHAAFSALILRDEMARPQQYRNRREEYQVKRQRFGGPSVGFLLESIPQHDPVFELIWANIASAGEPRVKQAMLSLGKGP